MKPDRFLVATLAELEVATGIDRYRWSKYINGKIAMTERTLSRAAEALDVEPERFLQLLIQRRQIAQSLDALKTN